MSNDDLLDILDLVTGCLDSGAQFVLGFVSNATKDIREHRAPNFWVVFPATRLPEDKAFVRMVDQDAVPVLNGEISRWTLQEWVRLKQVLSDVHGQFSPLVDERFRFVTLETGVSASNDKAFISL
jgi:hypothetical protein